MNSGLEQIGELFENRFFLTAALHRFVEFICAVFRFVDRVIYIYVQVGCDDICDVGAAWDDKSCRQAKNAQPDSKTLKDMLFCDALEQRKRRHRPKMVHDSVQNANH